ncbi:C2H2 and C2HC zinc fingers superfamily protein, putative isoform 1 [Hibiscus syriacus]|uniref:C2H2 and C2HC zinc fingers superfamily protein, putative isoform 1 n=1 Tax=Hibiscus syriacus TaxID=106335 RepID=A0A6A3ARL6_HIBSY|nr:C2H2 and C2HC zinc fingers superfamily protein, putative isoform 1 [Hibiscus syriacus]
METVILDPNCNLVEETSPKLLLPPNSPDISEIFGDPQLSPRVGNKYQMEIPPMVTGTEHLSLLMDPVDPDGIPYLAHSFLLGLPLPVMWTRDEDIDYGDEAKGGSCKVNDGTKVDECVKSLKNSHLVPGLAGDSWSWMQQKWMVFFLVSKSFLEGKTSLKIYVYHLKTSVGLSALVEAVGIGKGKADLTGLAMEPPRLTQVSPEIPSGKASSSLTSSDIIRLLTGGFRLSKARCNNIFWEAVWPRLLARGWHSEQPKNRCSVSSKHYLLFLMPGVKKFLRRKLVKGNRYFDSVSDVLSKVASEPTLIELDSEGNFTRSCNEGNGSNLMKFTVVDSSLIHGGKASKMRELRFSPIDLMFTSKSIHKDAQDSPPVNVNHMLSKGDKCVTNARHREGIVASSTAQHIKFTTVDTSLLHGAKPSRVRELRYLPFKVEISSETNSFSGGNDDNLSDGSSDEHERKTADRLSNHGPVATDTKPISEPVAADSFMKGEGKYENDISNQDMKNSCTADQNLLIHQDKKTDTSEDARPRLNAYAMTEESHVTEKFSAGIDEQMGRVSILSSSSEGNPECEETSRGSTEKLPPQFPLDSRNGEPGCAEADGSQFIIVNNYALLKTSTKSPCGRAAAIVNPRRQSKRSRPLTTRVLEALESGFFNVKKTQKVRDVQAPAIQFSSPSRRARSRVKACKRCG